MERQINGINVLIECVSDSASEQKFQRESTVDLCPDHSQRETPADVISMRWLWVAVSPDMSRLLPGVLEEGAY